MDLKIINNANVYEENAILVSNIKNQGVQKENEKDIVNLKTENTLSFTEYSTELTDNAIVTYAASSSSSVYATSLSLSVSEGRRLQLALANMGFYNAGYDGNANSAATIRALKNFELVFNGNATGSLTNSLISQVYACNDAYMECLNSNGMTKITDELDLTNTHKKNAALTWTFLKEGMGLTRAQAAGIMGNIFAESAFSCANAQDSYGYSGEDNYSYSFSATDGVGYGLIQWTYSTRKQGLKDMATAMGRPVSNLGVQLAFLRKELTSASFASAWSSIKSASTYSQSSDTFMEKVCNPKVLNTQERRNYSLTFYNNLA